MISKPKTSGNPPHAPTKAQRELVALHTTMGTTQKVIASLIEIDEKTLRKHYRNELDLSIAKANATIGGILFNKAKAGDTTAMIFWLKTRARWSERTDVNYSNEDGSLRPTVIRLVAPDLKNE